MEQTDLDKLRNWFDSYVIVFYTNEAEYDRNIQLKVEHTRKVSEVMDKLTAGEGLLPAAARIAQAVALLHDIGRFPQYRRWRSFRDRDSDNHARLAIEVIREQRLLDNVLPRERLLIEEAVRFHNLLEVPARLKSDTGMFLLLIRDADKLDIWRVFVEHFDTPPEKRASAALLGFPEKPGVSESCLEALSQRRIVNLNSVNSINDFKLLLISWVYNLNFKTSYCLLQESDFINRLLPGLPDCQDVRFAADSALEYVRRRSKSEVDIF